MKTRKIAYLGMLMALALVLSYVESLIPFAVGIPGVKLGLTNIVTVIMLYIAAPMETFLLCVFRAVLSGFMFGNAFSIIYSLAGCILSFIVMYLLKKSDKLRDNFTQEELDEILKLENKMKSIIEVSEMEGIILDRIFDRVESTIRRVYHKEIIFM